MIGRVSDTFEAFTMVPPASLHGRIFGAARNVTHRHPLALRYQTIARLGYIGETSKPPSCEGNVAEVHAGRVWPG